MLDLQKSLGVMATAVAALGACSADESGSAPGGGTGGLPVDGAGGGLANTGGGVGIGGGGPGTGGGSPGTGPCVPGTAYPVPAPLGDPTAVYQGTGNGLFEGPVWVAGAVFLSDMTFLGTGDPPPAVIHRYDAVNGGAVWLSETGSNGMAVRPDGFIVAATHLPQDLTLFDVNTTGRQALNLTYNGAHFNSPNDVTVRADGNTYFTDPDWQLGTRTSETGITGVYRVAPDGVTVALVDGTLDNPNGIALSPDGSVLYVGDYNFGGTNGRIGTYPVAADGSTGPQAEFAAGLEGPDGMTIDCAGNLYATQNGPGTITIYDPSGAVVTTIQVAASLTNLAFGGPGGTTLYATAFKTLYSIPMNVPGNPY